MNKIAVLSLILASFTLTSFGQSSNAERLYGDWEGIKMFQDQESREGPTYFLPNKGHMKVDQNYIHIYYYPYFKSARFEGRVTEKSIYYTINDKKIQLDYEFKGDTLAFKMTYINKTFVKLFVPAKFDDQIISELDTYGFRTNKLRKEMEVDTLLVDEKAGFKSYDELGFEPFQHLQFVDENTLLINKTTKVNFEKGYNQISFKLNGTDNQWNVQHLSGTQGIYLTPTSECSCDSIAIHYMNVEWADRMRQAIIDEENF